MIKRVLTLEGRRSCYGMGYALDDTMTVGELIDFLKGFDRNMRICLENDNGYTFGEIDENSFKEKFYSDETEESYGSLKRAQKAEEDLREEESEEDE